MTPHELLTFFNPSTTLPVFNAVARERTVRFKDLLDALESADLDREQVHQSLEQLQEAKLIESQDAPEGVENFRWYYVTEEGLTAERELRRLQVVN